MSEFIEHTMVCNYLRSNHPDVIFFSDLSGVKLPWGLAHKVASLKSQRGIPDLVILEPRNGYHGLVIELKKTGNSPYKKDGSLKSDPHVHEQADVLKHLTELGYYAQFAVGFEEARRIINNYFDRITIEDRGLFGAPKDHLPIRYPINT